MEAPLPRVLLGTQGLLGSHERDDASRDDADYTGMYELIEQVIVLCLLLMTSVA